MPTISDVARTAGVSTSTVSHVMNNTRKVNAATRLSVEAAIASLNYRPSVLARALAGSFSNSAGIMVSAGSNPYFSDIVFSLIRECASLGLTPLLADSQDDGAYELNAIRMLHQRRVDGIILVPIGGAGSPTLAYLREHRIPAVLVDQLVDSRFDQVGLRNAEAAKATTLHLARQGHVRIAFVGGHPDSATTIERVAGYRAALAEAGIDAEPALLRPGARGVQEVGDIVRALLSHPSRPTALLGANNLATIGIMRILRALGLRVPGDIALAGIDDFEWADLFEPRLTAVSQPCAAIGKHAAELLARRIKNPSIRPRTTRLAPTLVIRDSCGASRALSKPSISGSSSEP